MSQLGFYELLNFSNLKVNNNTKQYIFTTM